MCLPVHPRYFIIWSHVLMHFLTKLMTTKLKVLPRDASSWTFCEWSRFSFGWPFYRLARFMHYRGTSNPSPRINTFSQGFQCSIHIKIIISQWSCAVFVRSVKVMTQGWCGSANRVYLTHCRIFKLEESETDFELFSCRIILNVIHILEPVPRRGTGSGWSRDQCTPKYLPSIAWISLMSDYPGRSPFIPKKKK